jgi:AraC family transcriptional regulator
VSSEGTVGGYDGSMIGDMPRQISSSSSLGWRSVLAQTYADPLRVESFTTAPSRELLVVLVTRGSYVIESRRGSAWHKATYRPGSVGVTAPGNTSRLRWHAIDAKPLRSLHLYLGTDLVRAGETLPDELSLEDPFGTAAAVALGQALRDRAPAIYADSLAQALTAHLVHRRVERPMAFGSRELHRVTEYMRAHLDADLALDTLAAEANISKFHFVRMFTRTTGLTPHRYLIRLRMQAGAEQLRTTGYTVQRIALTCGYRSPGQFAAAFKREYGLSPQQYRR